LAEKELRGAASIIEKAVAKLSAATEAARAKRDQMDAINIEEQEITEAILEAAQAIAKSTGVLVNAATIAQQEYQKLVKSPATKAVYKRDPQWAQGLISAAKTVAGSVQHLVTAGNAASQGNASEEALIVAARAVSAATAQLVSASRAKNDPNSASQVKLSDAAKSVTSATQQLVEAAKAAAKWEEEQQARENEEKFGLTDTKVKDMEKQMEILKLEKLLDRARTELGTMRKAEYSQTDPNFKPDFKPAPVKTAAQNARPGKVAWNTSALQK